MGLKGDYFRTLLTRCGMVVVAFAMQVVMARALGKDLRGSFAICWSFLNMLVMLSGFGVKAANTYKLATTEFRISQAFGVSLWIAIIGGIFAWFLGITAIKLPYAFFQKATQEEFILTISFVGLFVFSIYLVSILRGSMHFKAMNSMTILEPSVAMVATAIFCFGWHLGVKGALLGAACGPLAVVAGTILILRKDIRFRDILWEGQRLIPTTLRYGFRAYLGYFAQTMNLQIGTFVLGFLLPAAQVGFYAIAVSIVSRLWIIPDSLCVILMPKMARDKTASMETTGRAIRVILPVVVVAALIMALLAYPVIFYGLGSDFSPAIIATYILLIGAIFRTISKIVTSYLLSVDRPGLNSSVKLFCIGMNVILPIILVPRYQLVGGAMATMLSYILESIIMIYLFILTTRIGTWKHLLPQDVDFILIKDMLWQICNKNLAVFSKK